MSGYDGSDVQIIYDPDGDNVDLTQHAIIAGATFDSASNATPGTCEIILRDLDRELSFITGKRIKLKIDGIDMWSGFNLMYGRGSQYPAGDGRVDTKSRKWTLDGTDNNILFDKRVLRYPTNYLSHIPYITTDTYDGDILKLALSDYSDMPDWLDITSQIDNVVYPAGGSITTANPWAYPTQGAGVRELADDLAAWSAAVWYVGPDDAVHYHAVQDRESPWGFSDRPNLGAISSPTGFEGAYWGFRELDAEEDGSQFATDALVWGGSPFAGAGGTVFHRATDSTLEAVHGKWQLAETHFGEDNYRLSLGVTQRANIIVFGNPTGDSSGAEPGSVPGEGPRGLRFPQYSYSFTWFTKDVPVLSGVPRHIYPGDLVPIQLWAYSEDGGATPFLKYLPLRTLRITFPSGAKDGKAHVQFTGGFDLRNEDSKFLWKFLRARQRQIQNATVATAIDTSDSAVYGAIGQFTLTPAPDGSTTVFNDTPGFGYIPGTSQMYVNGLLKPRDDGAGGFYTESDPDTGEFTFATAPSGTDELFVIVRTLAG